VIKNRFSSEAKDKNFFEVTSSTVNHSTRTLAKPRQSLTHRFTKLYTHRFGIVLVWRI